MNIKFQLPLIAVKSVKVSKRFYIELLDQKVKLDFGENVTFSGGFAIQENFAWLAELSKSPSYDKSNNMELYFEVDDFEAFMKKLTSFHNTEWVHPPKIYDWQQRVIRFYDPDGHMIEVGESMSEIARNFLRQGKTPEETAKLIQHPIEFVLASQEGKI